MGEQTVANTCAEWTFNRKLKITIWDRVNGNQDQGSEGSTNGETQKKREKLRNATGVSNKRGKQQELKNIEKQNKEKLTQRQLSCQCPNVASGTLARLDRPGSKHHQYTSCQLPSDRLKSTCHSCQGHTISQARYGIRRSNGPLTDHSIVQLIV